MCLLGFIKMDHWLMKISLGFLKKIQYKVEALTHLQVRSWELHRVSIFLKL